MPFKSAVLKLLPESLNSGAEKAGAGLPTNGEGTSCGSKNNPLNKNPIAIAKTGIVDTYGLDYKDTDLEAQAVIDANGNPYKQIATDVDGKIGIDYGVYGVPETYIIDKVGIIRYKQIGPITEEAFFSKILPLIRELQK